MSADILLNRLERVKANGAGRWMARCPSHDDRTASLSVRDDNGVVLINCFAGCSFDEIVGAAGVDASDLFPPRPKDAEYRPPVRKLIDAEAALKALEPELVIAVIAVSDARKGKPLSDDDHARFLLAAGRILDAIELARSRPMSEYERKRLLGEQLRPDELHDLEEQQQTKEQEEVTA